MKKDVLAGCRCLHCESHRKELVTEKRHGNRWYWLSALFILALSLVIIYTAWTQLR